jgi:beta-galactosidase
MKQAPGMPMLTGLSILYNKKKHMKSIITLFAFLFSTGLAAQTNQTLFDDGWTFSQDGKTISVNLPHDWDIYTAPNPESGATGTGGGWYAAGKGEYRKKFATPKGEIVKLHFEGVYQKAEVYVNGLKAGQHGYGYTPFTIDVTPYLFKGKRQNEVVVKVNNSEQPNCRWYSGSGIYRHVWLETMPALHIAENGVFVTTPKIEANKAIVNVEVTVQNEGNSEQQSIVEVEGLQKTVLLKAGESKKVDFSYTISNPHLWSPDDPYLYTANVKLSTLNTQISTKYGIRSFSFDAEKGFVLNGKPMVLNGACVHHDDGVLGSMAFDAAEIRKVKLMKEAGFNLIRTSHNPTTRAFLDACDSIGMLVIGEAFDGWRTAKLKYDYSTMIDSCYREDIHAMVLRDRNHPCIISWSLGNEVIERKELRVVHTARLLKKAVLEIDDTRPITEALCAWDRDWEIYDPHFDVLDVAGYNYMIFKHASDHQRNPKRVMWQTESYPRDAFRNWATVNDHPYVVGDMVWTGLDYLGESGIGRYYYEGERPGESFAEGGQPDWHGAYCGDVDITGWRKPISHYREMLWDVKGQWSKANGLYMAVKEPNGYRGNIKETMWSVWPTWESWNWTGSTDYKGEAVPSWEGKPIDVEVYTKAPEVKLYLNDKLVGTKQVNRETQFKAVFSIPYEVGVLRAEADGKSVTLATAGEPARLRLTADRNVIAAGGQDLAYITVEVVDKDGRVCPDAAIPCEAVVKGQGQLMAFASADLKDREPKTSSRVTTWKGRALLVVRSSKTSGKAQINIKSSLPTATLTIISK